MGVTIVLLFSSVCYDGAVLRDNGARGRLAVWSFLRTL